MDTYFCMRQFFVANFYVSNFHILEYARFFLSIFHPKFSFQELMVFYSYSQNWSRLNSMKTSFGSSQNWFHVITAAGTTFRNQYIFPSAPISPHSGNFHNFLLQCFHKENVDDNDMVIIMTTVNCLNCSKKETKTVQPIFRNVIACKNWQHNG